MQKPSMTLSTSLWPWLDLLLCQIFVCLFVAFFLFKIKLHLLFKNPKLKLWDITLFEDKVWRTPQNRVLMIKRPSKKHFETLTKSLTQVQNTCKHEMPTHWEERWESSLPGLLLCSQRKRQVSPTVPHIHSCTKSVI